MQFRPAVKTQAASGFTLIELSIVLVIVGLIIGGVLVGRDLISAATVRSQISQIEKYQTAVNTFRGKYGYLPGDIPDPVASQYGLGTRGSIPGEGDGNGLIQGSDFVSTAYGYMLGGESAMFWKDLSQVGLIEGGFTAATSTAAIFANTPSGLNIYFPVAKLGLGNYVFVSNGGCYLGTCVVAPPVPWESDGKNYFTVENAQGVGPGGVGQIYAPANTIPVNIAYAIDKKTDDGLPMSGKVTAEYLTNAGVWFANAPCCSGQVPYTTPTSPSPTSCYDNGGTNGATQQYSMSQNSGSGANCSVTFQFQ